MLLPARIHAVVLVSKPHKPTLRALAYVANLRHEHPRDLVVIYLSEYVVGHLWEQLLHNQSARPGSASPNRPAQVQDV